MSEQNTDQLLTDAMTLLGAQPKAIFLGQNVAYDGNVMFKHFANVPMEQRLELPVTEEMQMGMATGLALQGYLPISMHPRFDFLLLAVNQLVNHLDKLPACSDGQWQPKVIIRTKIGSKWPLDAGPQHTQDLTESFRLLLETVHIERINQPQDIIPTYQRCISRKGSSLVVEGLGQGRVQDVGGNARTVARIG